ncbi:MAG: metallopeptidase TldD-related protein [Candidatus Aenigmarchaeota archaeon]|nr:metallopeptidase TldD-related protein [Candidatus Aenigmarchaeota archaeon]
MDAREIGLYAFNEGLKYADEVAVIANEIQERLTRFANNEPTLSTKSSRILLNFLFKKNKRIIQTYMEIISKEQIRNYLKTLASRIKFLPEHKDYAELPEGPFKYKKVKDIFDPKVLDTAKNLKSIDIVINSALKNGARRVCGSFKTSLTKTYLFTSKRVETLSNATTAILELRALAKEKIGKLLPKLKLEGKISEASGASTTCGTRISDLKPKEAGEEAGKLAKLSENPIRGKEGRYDVVFGRNAAAVVFSEVGKYFSAFFVDANLSCFTNKLNEKVASEIVTICEDGTIAGGIGSVPFDEEGYPTQKNELISKGIAKNYLHNSITARKFKAKLTGNAGWVIPFPHNIYVEQGNWGEDELVKEVKRGIYINNLGYLRYQDEMKGDFSAVVRDGVFLIENGEITKPVWNLRLNANLLELLKNIEGISKNSIQTFHWWMEAKVPVFTPKILVRGIRFTLPTK